MDLSFTAEELAFRHQIRDGLARSLPAGISPKVLNFHALRSRRACRRSRRAA